MATETIQDRVAAGAGASSGIGAAAAGALNARGALVQPEHVAVNEVLLGPATSRCEDRLYE